MEEPAHESFSTIRDPTYGNECVANAAGVSAVAPGECGQVAVCELGGVLYPHGATGIPALDGCNTCSCEGGALSCTEIGCPEQKPCGGMLGDTCAANQYCDYRPGQHCGAADATATCVLRPESCPLIDEPVCGCDSETYSNACLANSAGTGVYEEGECN